MFSALRQGNLNHFHDTEHNHESFHPRTPAPRLGRAHPNLLSTKATVGGTVQAEVCMHQRDAFNCGELRCIVKEKHKRRA